jgi:hypothetical protein
MDSDKSLPKPSGSAPEQSPDSSGMLGDAGSHNLSRIQHDADRKDDHDRKRRLVDSMSSSKYVSHTHSRQNPKSFFLYFESRCQWQLTW